MLMLFVLEFSTKLSTDSVDNFINALFVVLIIQILDLYLPVKKWKYGIVHAKLTRR